MEGELDPDFDHIVKYARQKSGLTQEQLAAKIMEKALIIKKIERKELILTISCERNSKRR